MKNKNVKFNGVKIFFTLFGGGMILCSIWLITKGEWLAGLFGILFGSAWIPRNYSSNGSKIKKQ